MFYSLRGLRCFTGTTALDGWLDGMTGQWTGREIKSNRESQDSSVTDNRSRNGITRPVGSHY